MKGQTWCSLALLLIAVLHPCLCSSDSNNQQVETADEGGHFKSTVAARCSMNFAKMDYSSITSKCVAPNYDKSSCCNAFNKLACKYRAQVNDFTSTCPIEFMSYLNLAGNYQDGIFIGRCNTNNNICSN